MKLLLNVGDCVTCKVPVESYCQSFYERQHGYDSTFTPGMVGTVVSFPPKVRIVLDGTCRYDRRWAFVFVVFDTPYGQERVGLNYSNCVKVQSERIT